MPSDPQIDRPSSGAGPLGVIAMACILALIAVFAFVFVDRDRGGSGTGGSSGSGANRQPGEIEGEAFPTAPNLATPDPEPTTSEPGEETPLGGPILRTENPDPRTFARPEATGGDTSTADDTRENLDESSDAKESESESTSSSSTSEGLSAYAKDMIEVCGASAGGSPGPDVDALATPGASIGAPGTTMLCGGMSPTIVPKAWTIAFTHTRPDSIHIIVVDNVVAGGGPLTFSALDDVTIQKAPQPEKSRQLLEQSVALGSTQSWDELFGNFVPGDEQQVIPDPALPDLPLNTDELEEFDDLIERGDPAVPGVPMP